MFAGLDDSDCWLVWELNSILYNCKKSGLFENFRLCLSVWCNISLLILLWLIIFSITTVYCCKLYDSAFLKCTKNNPIWREDVKEYFLSADEVSSFTRLRFELLQVVCPSMFEKIVPFSSFFFLNKLFTFIIPHLSHMSYNLLPACFSQ